ncbi:MAG: hypothetical protein U1E42_13880 [Rhodospirillales bacterium]
MTDLFRLVGPLRPTTASETTVRSTSDRQQPGRSATGQRDDADTLRAALDRLDQYLKSGEPPRADARKGSYLNVVV